MKKPNLLLALACPFILASCGNIEASITESSLFESESSLIEEVSSVIQGTSINGDTSRTYLNNAIEESFGKKGYSVNGSSFKISALVREYTVGSELSQSSNEYALTKTNNTQEGDILVPITSFEIAGRDNSTHDGLGWHMGFQDMSLTLKENGVQSEKEEHINANLYLKDNNYYYDFLGADVVETPSIGEMAEGVVSMVSDDLFSLGTKGFIDGSSLGIDSFLESSMPRTSFAEFLPMAFDMVFDGFDNVDGVTFAYEGIKTESNEKYFTTSISITKPEAILVGIRSVVENLPDIVDEILGDEISIDDILETIDNIDIDFSLVKNFNLDLSLMYTPTLLKTVDFDLNYEGKDTGRTTIIGEDESSTVSQDILERLSASGSMSFSFDDNISIDYPSFVGYTEVE